MSQYRKDGDVIPEVEGLRQDNSSAAWTARHKDRPSRLYINHLETTKEAARKSPRHRPLRNQGLGSFGSFSLALQ